MNADYFYYTIFLNMCWYYNKFLKQYQSEVSGKPLWLTDVLDNRFVFPHCLEVLFSVCSNGIFEKNKTCRGDWGNGISSDMLKKDRVENPGVN